MKLTPREARLIEEIRRLQTAKVTAVVHRGEIVNVKSEIDAVVADKAAGKGEIWKKADTVRLQEVPKEELEPPDTVTTREGG